ncbi:MAG: polysaccharide deacetylase family protein [Candidatus Latescibacteria bacterium]|nr:polysaccharide deacetylase family protein [Candidatus Latescibacterota bacterium]
MTRRDLGIGLLVTAVAATAFVAGMGLLVARGFDSSGGVRFEAPAPRPASMVADDGTAARIPVLCYHYLRDKSDPLRLLRVFGYVVLSLPLLNDSELWTTSVSEFERHIQYLKESGYYTITLDELHEWQSGRRELPGRPVVITFDDGDESVYELGLPILARYGFRASLFVVTGRVGTKWDDVNCLDWSRLRELDQSGVFRIESHSHDMHYKVEAEGTVRPVFVAAAAHGFEFERAPSWEDAVREDLMRSRDEIEKNIGRASAYLAWPYGATTPELDRIALEAGFLRTCTLRARPNPRVTTAASGAAAPTEIARYTITARTSLRDFRAMLDGTYRPNV